MVEREEYLKVLEIKWKEEIKVNWHSHVGRIGKYYCFYQQENGNIFESLHDQMVKIWKGNRYQNGFFIVVPEE